MTRVQGSLVIVTAGAASRGIGRGIVANGALHHGANGAAVLVLAGGLSGAGDRLVQPLGRRISDEA